MISLVNVGRKSLADYGTIAARGLMDEILRLAEPLAGKRLVHLSATAFGGGVAEINYTLVPLMADAGLDVEWRLVHGRDEFFQVTRDPRIKPDGINRSDIWQFSFRVPKDSVVDVSFVNFAWYKKKQ